MESFMKLQFVLVLIMLTLNDIHFNKKGFTLIEVVCSSAVCLIFACAISSILRNVTINRSYYNKTTNYILCLEAIKNKVCCNCSSADIEIIYKENGGKHYINRTDVDINRIKINSINELISINRLQGVPYIEISITKNNVYQFNLVLHYICNGREESINYYFIKGRY